MCLNALERTNYGRWYYVYIFVCVCILLLLLFTVQGKCIRLYQFTFTYASMRTPLNHVVHFLMIDIHHLTTYCISKYTSQYVLNAIKWEWEIVESITFTYSKSAYSKSGVEESASELQFHPATVNAMKTFYKINVQFVYPHSVFPPSSPPPPSPTYQILFSVILVSLVQS